MVLTREASAFPARGGSSFPSAAGQGPAIVAANGRHGSLRRLGHGGRAVGTPTPATTGRTRPEGMLGENWMATDEVPLGGSVSLNDQVGCVPLGAAIVTLIREPAR